MAFIEFRNVSKIYKMGEVEIRALDDISFSIDKGAFVVVLGNSGAGKTTILNILGGMDTVSAGHVVVDGNDISQATDRQLCDYRRYDIGFVFQFYNLVQNLTARENVDLAVQLCKDPLDSRSVLKMVGLEDRMNNFPSQLSGGEQQRVSIARAVAKNADVILCDEPTGALDYETGKEILTLLQKQAHEEGKTVIIVTHNSALADMADHLIRIKNGQIVLDEHNDSPKQVAEIEW